MGRTAETESARSRPHVPPRAGFDSWLIPKAASDDPKFFAVLDRATGGVEGRQSLMDIVPQHGAAAGSGAATRATSPPAALRFGFTLEGVFRNYMVVKGENRDTAQFSITDDEWPSIGARFLAWLDRSNFDAEGRQMTRLGG